MSLVYASFDGVLDPLGYSQVARVLEELGRRGFRYHLVSLERGERLGDRAATEAVRARFADAGVRWSPLPYATGRGASARNVARLASGIAAARPSLVHARAFQAGLAALPHRAAGAPLLFDARGYWIDDRLEDGRPLAAAPVISVLRRAERAMFRSASAVVTLTELMAEDVRGGRFGATRARDVRAIPTCADFDEFRLREDGARPRPPGLPRSPLVLGIVGSVNSSYLMTEAFELAARVLVLRPDAHLAVLTAQRPAMEALADRALVPAAQRSFHFVAHADMPAWIPHLDWSLQLLHSRPSKRGSVPTKLAESLAAGARPLHHGCNDEVAGWVERTGAGLVLRDLAPRTLDEAAARVAATERDPAALRHARAIAEPHFSLRSGADRYAEILSGLGFAPAAVRRAARGDAMEAR